MKKRFKIIFVAGARPNFIKIAPLVSEFKKYPSFDLTLVHTGQHYDEKMSRVFFDELKIPKPDINLGVGGGSHAEQTGKIMIAFDSVAAKLKPDLIVVVGDVNSTAACALVGAKLGIKVAHVEAGLRSFDWTMPEEINRVITDRLSDFLFCTEESAVKNLLNEGINSKKIHFVGNVMIDTLKKSKVKSEKSKVLKILGLEGKKYAVATLHRPNNVDDKKSLSKCLSILKKISSLKLKVVFPLHPRTQKNIKKWGMHTSGILITEPLGYLEFLKLINHSKVVLTDSGGIQEETTVLGVPCLTLRKNTERPVTVTNGTNKVVGIDEKKIVKLVSGLINKPLQPRSTPKFWDGKASQRIAKIILKNLKNL